jgi:hypothetical protein
LEINYARLQVEIVMHEYKLWDYKRNGVDESKLEEIEHHITYLRSLRKPQALKYLQNKAEMVDTMDLPADEFELS